MKKVNPNPVILFMAISVAGIILVQVLWIRNALNVKQDLFDLQVSRSLEEVVADLEKNENIGYIENKVWQTDSLTNTGTGPTEVSTSYKYSYSTDGDSNHEVIVVSGDKGRTTDEEVVITSVADTDKPGMFIINSGSDSTYVISDAITAFIPENDSARVVVKKRLERLNRKVYKLDNMIDRMVVEFETYRLPVRERLNHKRLEASLNEALLSRKINLPYEYAIVNDSARGEPALTSHGFDPQKQGDGYEVSLFPGDVFDRGDQLLLYFPGKRSYLAGTISYLLGGSGLLSLLLLLTFGYTIRALLRQKRISEMKTDFINNVTHEFKTPIATISLAADAIENQKVISQPENIRYYLGMIREENRRMNAQVEQVLRVALLDKHELELKLVERNLQQLIRRAVEPFMMQVEKRNGKLELKLGASANDYAVDDIHFINVLHNLLDNALKYSTGKPEISVSTEDVPGGISISVSDHGIGISSEDQKRIFDRFYRKASGNVHNVQGTGLGLSYSRAIVELSGGKISVESEPGKGSTFIIILPESIRS